MNYVSSLDQIPLTTLKGVGPKMALKLEKLHLHTVMDALFHLPSRYQDRTRLTRIAELRPNEFATVVAAVVDTRVHYGRRRALLCRVSDGSGTLTLRFFQFSGAQQKALHSGAQLHIYGEVRPGPTGPEIIHPEYKAQADGPVELEETLTPIYPTTEGVYQAGIRTICEQALTYLNEQSAPELLPAELAQGQMSLSDAIRVLHMPPTTADQQSLLAGVHPAQRRLALEELLAHHVSRLIARAQAQQVRAPSVKNTSGGLTTQFLQRLPFAPTDAQKRVATEIADDMAQPYPMLRLVQGDVGSGKTVVAALAALPVIEAGYQVALMAPTEILAEQHALNFRLWFEALGIRVGWLAGKSKGKSREQTLAELADGQIQFIVGTHALFQEAVQFKSLALVIIDEQHRFGVHQRLALREKGESQGIHPHQLVMTATPIPRTLAMTAYADLATSVIDQMPPGRTPVTTVAIPETRRGQIIERVQKVCTEENRQAYWVCTLIEESEALQCQAAEDTAAQLQNALPELTVGLVHGRIKPAEKEAVMNEFKAADIDLLVATTVIEVGVDVPNASLMIIENPERLGLAQLHQLRGRVGRGSAESHCVLLYKTPLTQQANQRLAVLRESTDGFVIAERDLELRGPGELLGARQTGLAQMKVADLVRDQALIPQVRQLAQALVAHYPEQSEQLMKRWLPQGERYAQV